LTVGARLMWSTLSAFAFPQPQAGAAS